MTKNKILIKKEEFVFEPIKDEPYYVPLERYFDYMLKKMKSNELPVIKSK